MMTPEQIVALAKTLGPGRIYLSQEEYLEWRKSGKYLPAGTYIKVNKESLQEKPMTQDVQSTLNDRAKTHGSFIDNGEIMQLLKTDMRIRGKNWDTLAPHQREALEMIQHKIGRILSGNPNEPDHWRDIAGYATLVENILTTGQSHVSSTTK